MLKTVLASTFPYQSMAQIGRLIIIFRVYSQVIQLIKLFPNDEALLKTCLDTSLITIIPSYLRSASLLSSIATWTT